MEFRAASRLLPDNAILSDRELQVWKLVCRCLSNKEIAFSLGISESNVKARISALLKGLRLANRAELLRMGLERPESLESGRVNLDQVA